MKIFLIGFMGSGKSSVGKKLSAKLGYEFKDMDHLIEENEGMSISDIFREKGEKKFREMEQETLTKLISGENIVISTGGGVPCQPGNMDLINMHGISIYLRMETEDLFERLKARKARRPLIKDLSDAELKDFIIENLADRESYYNQAKYIVDGSKRDVVEILGLIMH